jgi:hypothetical protein
MSDCTAKLCVWVTEFGDPCHIMQSETFYVHITLCDGNVLKWCDRTYSYIPTKCGMVEIEVPPGCYSVFATHTPKPGEGVPPFGNRLTHLQVVRVNCGDHVCVTLFSPSIWYCGTWFMDAVNAYHGALEKNKIDPKLATNAAEAVNALLGALKPTLHEANAVKAVRAGAPPK